MSLLAPQADRAVRRAVDAFFTGALRPSMLGETLFETKNGRYRLMDGVLFSANDPSMVGAELVGWLLEGPEKSVVQDGWIAGARAVMVDRRKSRHIIVTSTSRLFRVDATGSGARRFPAPPAAAGSDRAHGSAWSQAPDAPRASLPPPTLPPPSSTHGPLTPRRPIPNCPPAPIGRLPGTTELSVATAMLSREPYDDAAVAMPPPPRSLRAPITRLATPVHPPPRRTGNHPRVVVTAHAVAAAAARPLPYPSAPPPKASHVSYLSVDPDPDTEDPTAPHARADLPLPTAESADAPPPSGLRRASNPTGTRKASRRGIPLR